MNEGKEHQALNKQRKQSKRGKCVLQCQIYQCPLWSPWKRALWPVGEICTLLGSHSSIAHERSYGSRNAEEGHGLISVSQRLSWVPGDSTDAPGTLRDEEHFE